MPEPLSGRADQSLLFKSLIPQLITTPRGNHVTLFPLLLWPASAQPPAHAPTLSFVLLLDRYLLVYQELKVSIVLLRGYLQ